MKINPWKMKFLIGVTLIMFLCSPVFGQQLPVVSSGGIVRFKDFKSGLMQARNVDVWLPAGYDSTLKYDVIYMHDGQMLFDSTITWNHKEWQVDETLSRLISEKKIEKCIVVGIWNTGADRIAEYFPGKIASLLDEAERSMLSDKFFNRKSANGDNYLKFIVSELKPFIDSKFPTIPDKAHTFMIGSSMGGLISIYAICEYPDVFGGVACLSTAWLSQIEPNYAIPTATFEYLKQHMPLPAGHKIYFDYGTGESDKPYEATQLFVDLIAKGKGYTGINFMSKTFKGDKHDEIAWSRRFSIPVEFLMTEKH
jgi:predicted alpha/beta superfamily hydrolase